MAADAYFAVAAGSPSASVTVDWVTSQLPPRRDQAKVVTMSKPCRWRSSSLAVMCSAGRVDTFSMRLTSCTGVKPFSSSRRRDSARVGR